MQKKQIKRNKFVHFAFCAFQGQICSFNTQAWPYLFTVQGMGLLTFSAVVAELKPLCDANGCHLMAGQTSTT